MEEMVKLAERAVEASRFWGRELDYSAESLEWVDALAQKVFVSGRKQQLPDRFLAGIANLYGAYLGEVLLRSGLDTLDFAWRENEEGVIGIGREDMWADPAAKVYKRITQGPEHDLMSYFEIIFGMAIGAVDLNDPRVHVLSEEEV